MYVLLMAEYNLAAVKQRNRQNNDTVFQRWGVDPGQAPNT